MPIVPQDAATTPAKNRLKQQSAWQTPLPALACFWAMAAAWAQHSDENPLVVIQLDIVNAYPSADRQAQFDVLAGRASKSYDNGHVHMGDAIPCPDSLRHYWSYFESMPGTTSTLHFSNYEGQAHKIACNKGGQQVDAF